VAENGGTMRVPGLLCVALLLCGCARAERDGTAAGHLLAPVTDAVAPAPAQMYPGEVDDAKCRDLGHEPSTPGYGNCRLELEMKRGGQFAFMTGT